MLGSKENSHHFLSSIESTLVLTFGIISLQIYWTTLHSTHPSLLTQTLNGKECLMRQNYEKNIYKRLLLFLCIAYSMPATFLINRCFSRRLEEFTQMIRLILIYLWPNHGVNAVKRKSHLCIPFLGIERLQSQFPHSCVGERYIYIPRIGPHILPAAE
jgi:hypothetical protein